MCIRDSIMRGFVFRDGCFELKNCYWNAVDKQNHIRAAQTLTLNRILVYHFEFVVLRRIKIDIVDVQGEFARLVAGKVKSLVYKPKRLTVSVVKRRGGNKTQTADDF